VCTCHVGEVLQRSETAGRAHRFLPSGPQADCLSAANRRERASSSAAAPPSASPEAVEIPLPALVPNPKSIQVKDDTAITVNGECTTPGQAKLRAREAKAEAWRAVLRAVWSAARAGVSYEPPPGYEAAAALAKPSEDLAALEETASGALVDRAKRGELSLGEQQQLLGLSDREFASLQEALAAHTRHSQEASGAQAGRARKGAPPARSRGPRQARGNTAPAADDESLQPGEATQGFVLMRARDIKAKLKGQTILVRQGRERAWETAKVLDIDVGQRLAILLIGDKSSPMKVDLSRLIGNNLVAHPVPTKHIEASPSPSVSGVRNPSETTPGHTQTLMQQQQQMAHAPGLEGPRLDFSADQPSMGLSPIGGGQFSGGQTSGQVQSCRVVDTEQGDQWNAGTFKHSVIEAIVQMGPNAHGMEVEVMILSNRRTHRGVVSGVHHAENAVTACFGQIRVVLKVGSHMDDTSLQLGNSLGHCKFAL